MDINKLLISRDRYEIASDLVITAKTLSIEQYNELWDVIHEYWEQQQIINSIMSFTY